MLRNDDKVFKNFGEIYFSTIFKDKIKAWHLHKEATLNYACVYGEVKLVLFDERKGSGTFGEYQELLLSLKDSSPRSRKDGELIIAVKAKRIPAS